MGIDGINSIIDKAHNGEEALKLVKLANESSSNGKEYCYGLIFMDCSMPIMNGFDSTEQIRRFCDQQQLIQPKIVAVTGHSEEEYI